MIDRVLLLSLFTFSYCNLFSQETVYWANEVIDVSSEYSPLEYSALQVLHKPNVVPGGGDNPNAWRPKRENARSFVVVSFEKPVKAKQIAIAESENPGAVTKVYAYDIDYNEYLLFELTPRAIPLQSRLLNLFFEEPAYLIESIKVELDCKSVDGYNAIDAIGVSYSNIPINVLIDIAQYVNQDIETERLGKNVNSSYAEHSPLLSPDGKRLYFSRQYHPGNMGGIDDNEDIWYSELDTESGEWQPAVNIGPPLNNEGPNFISSITKSDDATILLLGNRYEKGRMVSGVSMAVIDKNGKVSKPQNIDIEDNYNYSENADFFLSENTEFMLSAVERDDTQGGRDLYVSIKKKNGIWSIPRNLGPTVNTLADEVSPYLATDLTTMYFSTSGFKGYGGKDIFVTKRLDDTWTKWSPPENLGKGINTKGDDVYFNMPTAGKHIYFTRGDVDENTDIFRFQAKDFFVAEKDSLLIADVMPIAQNSSLAVLDQQTDIEKSAATDAKEVIVKITGKVLNEKTNGPISALVVVERLPDGVEIGNVRSDASTGKYSFNLRPGARYGFLAKADGFLSINENLDLNEVARFEEIERDLFLTGIEKDALVTFNNIFFDFDKAELNTASYVELKRVLDLLKSNKIGKIQISGYTDDTGPGNYNLELSRRRAEAVCDYFRKNGIDRSRLLSKWYGEKNPELPNTSSANREMNRRVVFKVVEGN